VHEFQNLFYAMTGLELAIKIKMNKEFIPYEQALALKELGFDEPCLASYYRAGKRLDVCEYIKHGEYTILAPTWSQAFRWFREKYNLRGFIGFRPNVKKFDHHIYDMSLLGIEYAKQRTMEEYNKDPLVGTYEEAELACLKKLIEISKNK
jgi:hypothetical protein